MLTIITGLIVAAMQGEIGQALKLGIGENSPHFTAIGFGMWLGIIMWFNVWFIIWPNQKKNMGLARSHARAEGQGGADRRPDVARQHPAVDSDALLHGIGARLLSISSARGTRAS